MWITPMKESDFNASLSVDRPTLKTLHNSASDGSFSPGIQRLDSSSFASWTATCSLRVVRETGLSVAGVRLTELSPGRPRKENDLPLYLVLRLKQFVSIAGKYLVRSDGPHGH
jgi:hypothetical protein